MPPSASDSNTLAGRARVPGSRKSSGSKITTAHQPADTASPVAFTMSCVMKLGRTATSKLALIVSLLPNKSRRMVRMGTQIMIRFSQSCRVMIRSCGISRMASILSRRDWNITARNIEKKKQIAGINAAVMTFV